MSAGRGPACQRLQRREEGCLAEWFPRPPRQKEEEGGRGLGWLVVGNEKGEEKAAGGVLGRNQRVSDGGKTNAFPFYFHPFAQVI